MKPITFLVLPPLLVAAGACSSHSGGGTNSGTGLSDGGSNDSGNGSTTSDSGNKGSGKDGSGGDASQDAGEEGDGAITTPYEAQMSGANVVPPVQTTATGDAKFTLEPDQTTLAYDITQSVSSPTAVNLHIGAPLESGAVTHQLTPISQHMTGRVTLTSSELMVLNMDQLYVDVLSQANPGGEIRGQLTSPGATVYVASLTGAQEVPAVTTTNTAHASFIVNSDGYSAIFHVKTTATPTNVLLQRGIAAISGQIVYSLTPLGQTIDGTQSFQPSDTMDIQAGHFYVNIQTAQNQTGELRGQLIPPGASLYSGALAGSNEVPPVSTMATGGAQFVLMPDLTTINYELDVTGILPISAAFYDGAAGATGTSIDSLTLDQTGALGTLMLSSSYLSAFQGGSTYVNVDTDSYSSGELRAQLVQQQ